MNNQKKLLSAEQLDDAVSLTMSLLGLDLKKCEVKSMGNLVVINDYAGTEEEPEDDSQQDEPLDDVCAECRDGIAEIVGEMCDRELMCNLSALQFEAQQRSLTER